MNLDQYLRKGAVAAALGVFLSSLGGAPAGAAKILVAHRGASAYAPEHTLQAYRLAIEQGADYVEQDLQITGDGVLVCLHDPTLERTTNVAEVFPGRSRQVNEGGVFVERWFVHDFSLEEIRRLDAGAWFGEEFRGARIPTFEEAIREIRGKAGLFPELKVPERYRALGFDMERIFLRTLRRHGLDRRGADPRTPVLVQSFSAESLRRLAFDENTNLSLVLLLGPQDRSLLSPQALKEVAEYARGIGPAKQLLLEEPEALGWARQAGLTVIPYTFRSSGVGRGFETVREEMEYFLYTLDVDGVFTDNPDQFPARREPPRGKPGSGPVAGGRRGVLPGVAPRSSPAPEPGGGLPLGAPGVPGRG